MKRKTILLFFLSICYIIINAQKSNDCISIKIQADTVGLPDSIDLVYTPVTYIEAPVDNTAKMHRNNMKWTINSSIPLYVSMTALKKNNRGIRILVEPGDSLIIHFINGKLFYSGRGFEKLKIIDQIDSVKNTIPKPSNQATYFTKNIADYLEWNEYFNEQRSILLTMIDSFADKCSPFVYDRLRCHVIGVIEQNRHDKFSNLWRIAIKNKNSSIEGKDLCAIYDSTFHDEPSKWFRNRIGSTSFITDQIRRKYNFPIEENEFNLQTKGTMNRRILYYEQGKAEYSGIGLSFFLARLMKDMIDEVGFTIESEKLLAQFYSEPGFSENKEFVKEYEHRKRTPKVGKIAPDFTLVDSKGGVIRKENLTGKIVLLNFRFADCIECKLMESAMEKVQLEFKNDTNIIFLNISTDADKEMWQKRIAIQQYNINTVNVITEGKAQDHPSVKAYNILRYPTLILIGHDGKILMNKVPDPRTNSEELIQLLKESVNDTKKNNWVNLNDGPYILHENDTSKVHYITNGRPILSTTGKHKLKNLFVATDQPQKYFEVKIKTDLLFEPSTFGLPEKLLAMSDIEGNFDALRQLLQANKVIDEKYNWIFGKGHVVFIGDMVDRGRQAIECLWLIYSLEEKAKAAGGYVHFILGNHEIMNLSGDLRYVQEKYKRNAFKIGKNYNELLKANSELGKWLRTKNIVEKIGNLLFVHAGISQEISDLGLSVQRINELARPYYARSNVAIKKTSDIALSTIFNSTTSPFWYRLYYMDQPMKIRIINNNSADTTFKPSVGLIDETLNLYQVNHIVTGHTIFKGVEVYGKNITTHYGGKIINTDTKHERGDSEALLIEGNKYYRVNKVGERNLLFNDDTNYSSTPE